MASEPPIKAIKLEKTEEDVNVKPIVSDDAAGPSTLGSTSGVSSESAKAASDKAAAADGEQQRRDRQQKKEEERKRMQ